MDANECTIFQAQTHLRDRCKNCFRTRARHSAAAMSRGSQQAQQQQSSSSSIQLEVVPEQRQRRSSWRDASSRNTQTTLVVGQAASEHDVQFEDGAPSTTDCQSTSDVLSVSSYRSANSRAPGSARVVKSCESLSNMDERSMMTAMSSASIDDDDDDRAATPTEDLTELSQVASPTDERSHLNHNNNNNNNHSSNALLVLSLRSELDRLREEVRRLRDERHRWARGGGDSNKANNNTADNSWMMAGGSTEVSLVQLLEDRLAEAEGQLQDARDENTVLKCELREIQEHVDGGKTDSEMGNAAASSSAVDSAMADKLKSTETYCEELMEENEALKADVHDLQREIEEMQDQYREDEIDSFRELQRELEAAAKTSRVLQFKLRKTERARDQAELEKRLADEKIKNLRASAATSGGDASVPAPADITSRRVRELESELRVAKEVSVRLHSELEQAEEKRARLEDEVFYMKDKVRELQTQAKWREQRGLVTSRENRKNPSTSNHGGASASSASISNDTSSAHNVAAVQLASAALEGRELPTDLRDALERELDLREQLRFAQEETKRSHARLRDVENDNEQLLRKMSKMGTRLRTPIARSNSAEGGSTAVQLELAEHEVETLSSRVQRLSLTNEHLAKRVQQLESEGSTAAGRGGGGGVGHEKQMSALTPEIERDMSAMLEKITRLESANADLQSKKEDAERRAAKSEKEAETSVSEQQLRSETERRRALEQEVHDLKSLLLKGADSRLLGLATRCELLAGQLQMAMERCHNLHRTKAALTRFSESRYCDELKRHIEKLEKELSDAKAVIKITELSAPPTAAVSPAPPATTTENAQAKIDDLEQCCEVLAAVEAQTQRLAKQLEKLDNSKDERRRSLSKESGASMLAELANVMTEMRQVRKLLDQAKTSLVGDLQPAAAALSSSPSSAMLRSSTARNYSTSTPPPPCQQCAEHEANAATLRDELAFYKKKNRDLTNQILATDERWSSELQRERTAAESEIATLTGKVSDVERTLQEQRQLLEADQTALAEKSKAYEEEKARTRRLTQELNTKSKLCQDMETEARSVKEWEIKYKKLEQLWEQERERMNAERAKTKNDTLALRRAVDELEQKAQQSAANSNERVEQLTREKQQLEKDLEKVRRSRDGSETTTTSDADNAVVVVQPRVSTLVTSSVATSPRPPSVCRRCADLEANITEANAALDAAKRECLDLRTDINAVKEKAARERDAAQHRARQLEKIRTVEADALQQKFTSRMKIMEDTNKTLHSQLVLARRQRDAHKEALDTHLREAVDQKGKLETAIRDGAGLQKKADDADRKLHDLEKELERTRTDLRLTKQARLADQSVSRLEHGSTATANSSRPVSPASPSVVEEMRRVKEQYADSERFYATEMQRLQTRVDELSGDALTLSGKHREALNELREQLRVADIERRNAVGARDQLLASKEALDQRLQKAHASLHLAELRRLTRKYRLSSIIDQLQYVTEPLARRSAAVAAATATESELPADSSLKYIITQLTAIRDEDNQNAGDSAGETTTTSAVPTRCSSVSQLASGTGGGIALLPFRNSDTDDVYDNMSQSSLSVRSVQSAQLRTTSTLGRTPIAIRSGSRASSVESAAWETRLIELRERAQSPAAAKKTTNYPEAPPSMIIHSSPSADPIVPSTGSKPSSSSSSSAAKASGGTAEPSAASSGRTVEYGPDGRLRYVSRSATAGCVLGAPLSYSELASTRSNTMSKLPPPATPTSATSACSTPTPSAVGRGTNILCTIRRQELARGGQPSVKMMAKAFDSMEKPARPASGRQPSSSSSSTLSFFGIRKSRSVDHAPMQRPTYNASEAALALPDKEWRDGSLTQLAEGLAAAGAAFEAERRPSTTTADSQTSGGSNAFLRPSSRHPLKGLGSRFVDRVRRSLSRSGRADSEQRRDSESESGCPPSASSIVGTSVPVAVFSTSLEATSPRRVKKKKIIKKAAAAATVASTS